MMMMMMMMMMKVLHNLHGHSEGNKFFVFNLKESKLSGCFNSLVLKSSFRPKSYIDSVP